MKFTKMNGAGNDYIFVYQPFERLKNPSDWAVKVSNRHFGVGADGLVLIDSSERGDAEMRIFNADGSEGRMCGNALRCTAKYLYERGYVRKDVMQIETMSGIKTVWLEIRNGLVVMVRADMGVAKAWQRKGAFMGYPVTYVDIGNPHAVIFGEPDTPETYEVLKALSESVDGGVNAEMVKVISPKEIVMRVYERGSGETMACGTGATASAYAAMNLELVEKKVTVRLKGGTLQIANENGRLFMTGDAKYNFEGEYRNG